MAMFLVVLRRSGPEWDRLRPLEGQSGWDEHAAFMDALVDAGFMVLGGPLGDEERVVHAVEAGSEDEIRGTLARDPWSHTHLRIDSIEPWTIRLDGRGSRPVSRGRFERWMERYEGAWRTAGTDVLAELFRADASYSTVPYKEPYRGLGAIAELWEKEREGPDETFEMTSELVAAEGDTAVARVEVRYGEPVNREYCDLWVITLDENDLCSAFEEWPFAPPGQQLEFN